jgi:hypothetical protein
MYYEVIFFPPFFPFSIDCHRWVSRNELVVHNFEGFYICMHTCIYDASVEEPILFNYSMLHVFQFIRYS